MFKLKEIYLNERSLTAVEEIKRYLERTITAGPEIVDFIKNYAKLYDFLSSLGNESAEEDEQFFQSDEKLPTFFKFISRKFKKQLTDGHLSFKDIPNPNEMKKIALDILKRNLKKSRISKAKNPEDSVDMKQFGQDMHAGKYGKLD